MQEIWKDIKGYEGLYQISNYGNVKRIATYKYSHKLKKTILIHIPKYLKKNKSRKGYEFVTLCNNTKRKTWSVHRLVAQAFIPNPENKPQINHIDCNKQNNFVRQS